MEESMKGTPEQIKRAQEIKAIAIERAFALIKNPKTRESLCNFAESKKEAHWWLLKSTTGENFLIIEHQKSIGSTPTYDNNNSSIIEHDIKRVRLIDFHLPKWMVDWLMTQPEPGEKLIEKALIETYKIQPANCNDD